MEDDSIFSGLKKKREEISNERALLSGATPLLVGLMTGNMGDAAEVASAGLLREDKRVLDEDKSLLSYLRKKQTASAGGKKRFSTTTLIGPKGKSNVHAFDTYTGTTGKELGQKGFSDKVQKNSEGVNVRWDAVTRTYVPIATQGQDTGLDSTITPKFEKRAGKIADTLISDTKSWRDAHQEMTEAKRLLADPSSGIFGTKVAVANLIKKVEKGRMSDEDRKYYISHLSKIRGMFEGVSKEIKGKEKARLIAEVNSSLDTLLKTTTEKISLEGNARAESFSDTPAQKELLLKRFGGAKGLAPKVIAKGMVTVSNGTETYDIPKEDLADAQKDGFEVIK